MSIQPDNISGGSASPADEDRIRKSPADGPTIVALVDLPSIVPPSGVAHLFKDPPLVGDEKREDYDKFFLAIAAAVNPVDDIAWLFTWDVTYLSWEIRRERFVKVNIIKSAHIEAVRDALEAIGAGKLKLLSDPRKNDREARQWASNSKSRREIDKKLADNGYGPSDIMARAYILGLATSTPSTDGSPHTNRDAWPS